MKLSDLGRPIEVLLIEDNIGDVRLTEEAVKDSKLIINLNVVMNGVEGLDYLQKKGEYADKCRPDLIILDLNLPKKNGHELLQDIKQDDSLKRIPVAILTTSTAEIDILKAYDLHANCYINKPVDMTQFIGVVKAIENFWFSIVVLP